MLTISEEEYVGAVIAALHGQARYLAETIKSKCAYVCESARGYDYNSSVPDEKVESKQRSLIEASENTLHSLEVLAAAARKFGKKSGFLSMSPEQRGLLNDTIDYLALASGDIQEAKEAHGEVQERLKKKQKQNRPTEPGYYWWREDEGHDWEIKNVVCREGDKLYVVKHGAIYVLYALDSLGGQWGPKIEKPAN